MGTEVKTNVYLPDDEIFGKKIVVLPKPAPEIGIDQTNQFTLDIIQSVDCISGDCINVAKLELLCHISQNRDTVFSQLDTMMEDPIISAAIEMYCEDATETNDKGDIVWVESSDRKVAGYIDYLLKDLNVEKNIYRWMNCLVKYGDVYLQLFHESEYKEDDLFTEKKHDSLNEDVILKAYRPSDNFAHYVKMVPNPASMFELTKFGKTYAYIQAPITAFMSKKHDLSLVYGTYQYKFKKKDVSVFPADNFVHGSLDDVVTRELEEIHLSLVDNDDTDTRYTYEVRRGKSALFDVYKIWRQYMLLLTALFLNRLSRSSSYKIVNVEMRDGPKNQAQQKLMNVKRMFEQKQALGVDSGLNEYNNSGPAENTIYVATYNGEGAISVQDLGSDLNVSGLDDVNLFKKKLYAALKIPPAFFGDVDDAGGFDGGTSLSLMSSRYAKTVKRFLNIMILTITDLINILLVDKGYSDYIGKYRLRMQEPTTREEVDRKDAQVNRITVVQNTMSLFDDILDPVARLTILKQLLSSVSTDAEILAQIDDLIAQLKQAAETEVNDDKISDTDVDNMPMDDLSADTLPDLSELDNSSNLNDNSSDTAGELPTPEALGVGDFSSMTF